MFSALLLLLQFCVVAWPPIGWDLLICDNNSSLSSSSLHNPEPESPLSEQKAFLKQEEARAQVLSGETWGHLGQERKGQQG